MTTLDKAPRPDADGRPAATTPPHDPTAPFYAVGGADPDFVLPTRGERAPGSFWARLFSSARRK
ncbi:hypothetical protein [Arthrobacter sp.]|uniref:hypothetical protein n=1 Tax=Arthrobacter sp. TaxID=1667 RepID=UPI003A9501B4